MSVNLIIVVMTIGLVSCAAPEQVKPIAPFYYPKTLPQPTPTMQVKKNLDSIKTKVDQLRDKVEERTARDGDGK